MDLRKAKVLVTGGSSGIGYATAQLLRDRGAAVAICGRNAEAVESAANELGALGIVADVSVESDVRRMVAKVIADLDGYDVLVNNAGGGTWAPLVETTVEDFTRVWQTNVLGAMLAARESAKHFVAKGAGNIVNIVSTAGQRGFASGTTYVATKFALAGMTECWRAELRKSNVRVMQVNPSEVQTNFFETAGAPRTTNETKLFSEDIAHTICSMLAMEDRGFVTDATVWATNPRD